MVGRGLLTPAAQDRLHKWQKVLETFRPRDGDYTEARTYTTKSQNWHVSAKLSQLANKHLRQLPSPPGHPTPRDPGHLSYSFSRWTLCLQLDTVTTTWHSPHLASGRAHGPHLPRRRKPSEAAGPGRAEMPGSGERRCRGGRRRAGLPEEPDQPAPCVLGSATPQVQREVSRNVYLHVAYQPHNKDARPSGAAWGSAVRAQPPVNAS